MVDCSGQEPHSHIPIHLLGRQAEFGGPRPRRTRKTWGGFLARAAEIQNEGGWFHQRGCRNGENRGFRGPACHTHGATLGNGTKGGFECARGRYLLALATPPHLGSIRSRRGGDLTRARPVTHYKTWIFGGVPNSGIAAASRRTAKSPAGFQIRRAGVARCEFGLSFQYMGKAFNVPTASCFEQ